MKCLVCKNDDSRFMFEHRKETVCRRCITFQQGIQEFDTVSFNETVDAEYALDFSLSKKQRELSRELIKHVEKGKDILVYAACGSGKTEIVLGLIKTTLEKRKIIGIAVPRRQVVLQLQSRLAKYFSNLTVIAVCEGYTDVVYGDLIICTTHQLFRYKKYFDVLIIDEPDAFPFANNQLLENIMRLSVKENIVYLSATPSVAMKKMVTLKLFRRYHNHDLLVPEVVVCITLTIYVKLMMFLRRYNNIMLFVPTIKLAKLFSILLSVPCIHSETERKEDVIEQFENRKYKILVCTTIMERGVTFENVNICVLFAEHPVFTKASLIQIAGRVGRSSKYPTGEGLFLCRRKSKKVDECIQELQMMNA